MAQQNNAMAIANFMEYDNFKFTTGVLENGSTFLTMAIRKASLNDIKYFIIKGVNVNLRETRGATPLLLATHLNRFDVVQCLVNNGARVNDLDSYESPLMVAVRKGYLDIVKFLITKGADINIINIEGISPLIWAIKENKVEILDGLLISGIPPMSIDSSGNPPLMTAVLNSSSKEIIQCLLKHGTEMKESPLTWAAKTGQLTVLQVLVENGANVNTVDQDGNTPLATAVRFRQIEIAQYLLSERASVCKVGKNGKTPLLWAIQNNDIEMVDWLLDHGSGYIIDNVFLDAIATNNLKIVKLLKERGAFEHKQENSNGSQMSLTKALDVASLEIAKYLIENGASVIDLGNEITYMMTFLAAKNHEMVKMLTENGARLSMFGPYGHTPLTKSVDLEDFEMVKFFVLSSANVDQANRNRATPLDVAATKQNFQIFQYLVDHGANSFKENEYVTRYYQIAKENCLKKQQILEALVSNQEEADDEEKESVAEEEVREEVEVTETPPKTLSERKNYFIEFD